MELDQDMSAPGSNPSEIKPPWGLWLEYSDSNAPRSGLDPVGFGRGFPSMSFSGAFIGVPAPIQGE